MIGNILNLQLAGGLYPEIEPYRRGFLSVGSGYEIYFEECGNPDGYPILFIHGGPGAGCDANDRRYFDPDKWRIILFDQRGCGRGKWPDWLPHGQILVNTTPNLVYDIDMLLGHLDIPSVVLFGGSWGSTLALCYAIAAPPKVRGMVLRGIFLGLQRESNYLYRGGIEPFFPHVWSRFLRGVPIPTENIFDFYMRQLTSDDEETRMRFARQWAEYELRLLFLEPKSDEWIEKVLQDPNIYSWALAEIHYMMYSCFLRNNFILGNCHVIRPDTPITIIQGQYDMVCPPLSAHLLKHKLPWADLKLITAGHSSSDPGVKSLLVEATDRMAEKLDTVF